ncbi:Uncharacterised protein [Serratia liquefaciens]|nr:Uncharacterised protein [Serratia liquefaciens]
MNFLLLSIFISLLWLRLGNKWWALPSPEKEKPLNPLQEA